MNLIFSNFLSKLRMKAKIFCSVTLVLNLGIIAK